jgi:hypothetical protein
MTKSTPIILDRLAEALARHGLKLKRQQLVQVAAAAFGYRNDKTFSAAAAEGDLDAPVAKSYGSDDQGLALIMDPVAGSVFAMDVQDRTSRAGRWTVSPYGNVIDIGDILANPERRAGLRVHVASNSHRHGVSFYVDTTEKGLQAQVAGFCDEWWDEARQGDEDLPETTEGMTHDEIVEAYFNAQTDEYIDRSSDQITVPEAVAATYASTTGEAWVVTRIDLEADDPVLWWSEEGGWGDLEQASVYADRTGQLPTGDDGQSVAWQRMPKGMVEERHLGPGADEPSRDAEWQRDTDDMSAQVGAIASGDGIVVAEGVTFRIVNAERLEDRTRTTGFRRRILIQTGGRYDRLSAETWRDAITPELTHASASVEVADTYARVILDGDGDMGDAGSPQDWMRAITDLLTPATGRERIMADFRPEAWVRNNAVEVDFDEAKEIDVTYEMLLIGREAALELDSGDSDHLLEAVRATPAVRQWSGPFTIDVHDAVEDSTLFGQDDADV